MKYLTALTLVLLATPAQAITWKEFWEPFRGDYHYHRHQRVERQVSCTKRIYHEEYVPGTEWSPGYVRNWTQVVKVPCVRW
jgi:hypothetical protein